MKNVAPMTAPNHELETVAVASEPEYELHMSASGQCRRAMRPRSTMIVKRSCWQMNCQPRKRWSGGQAGPSRSPRLLRLVQHLRKIHPTLLNPDGVDRDLWQWRWIQQRRTREVEEVQQGCSIGVTIGERW